MRLFLVLLILAGGYCVALCQMANLAIGQLNSMNQTYSNVSTATEAWTNGNTSASLTGN